MEDKFYAWLKRMVEDGRECHCETFDREEIIYNEGVTDAFEEILEQYVTLNKKD